VDLQLSGRTAVVTGASKGIGLACVEALLREGAKVIGISRDPGNLAAAQQQLSANGLSFDVEAIDLTDPEASAAAFERIGVPDVLINCAGAARRTPAAELDSKALHAAMEAKYFTYMHATEAVVRGMAERGSGAIVNIVGQGGRAANPLHIGGGAANAALMLASVGYAKAYADRGVRVNVINPGLTRTGRVDEGPRPRSGPRAGRRRNCSPRWSPRSRSGAPPNRPRSPMSRSSSPHHWPVTSPAPSSPWTAAPPPRSDHRG
jgi:NAD(P)-dependent dehydrogenase (short-subunit alcohol dehydrogenase family)